MDAMTRRAKNASDRGSELIELAIVLPLLLMIVAGIADFGFLFQRYEVVTNAAREGARIRILPGYSEADATDRVESYLNVSGLTDTATVSFAYPTETLGGTTVQMATVSVSYPSRFLFLGPIASLVGGSGWGSITLKAGSIMRCEATASCP